MDEQYKSCEIQNGQKNQNSLVKLRTIKMELPKKNLEQIELDTIPKIEEHMLIVREKSTHERHLSQPLQISTKQFKIAVTFLTGCNGIFSVADRIDKFRFTKSINYDDFNVVTLPGGAYELGILNYETKFCFTKAISDVVFIVITIPEGGNKLERLNDGIEKIITKETYITEEMYPFVIKTFQFSLFG